MIELDLLVFNFHYVKLAPLCEQQAGVLVIPNFAARGVA
jgi:hypothetical protein